MNLKEIKKTSFDILLEFKNFCESNNITYFLSNGTLLGAVKYKGFIPWDDDIDVFVPRNDYDRLIQLYKDNSKYRLYSLERCSDFKYPFAKLCDISTLKEENNLNNGIKLGIGIDIFPLDFWKDNLADAKKQVSFIQRKIEGLNFSKMEFSSGKNFLRSILKRIFIFVAKNVGSQRYLSSIIAEAKCCRNKNSKYIGCVAWPIYGEKEIISSDVFKKTVSVEFEGIEFPAPSGFDVYLRSLYGDYTKDPPQEKQVSHHIFNAYRL